MRNKILAIGFSLLAFLFLLLYWIGGGSLGDDWGAGTPNESRLAKATIESRAGVQLESAREIGIARPKSILFGDLHSRLRRRTPTAGGLPAAPAGHL